MDLNDGTINNGIKVYKAGSTNTPVNNKGGTVLMLGSSWDSQALQIAMANGTGGLYFRNLSDGGWGNWKKVYNPESYCIALPISVESNSCEFHYTIGSSGQSSRRTALLSVVAQSGDYVGFYSILFYNGNVSIVKLFGNTTATISASNNIATVTFNTTALWSTGLLIGDSNLLGAN